MRLDKGISKIARSLSKTPGVSEVQEDYHWRIRKGPDKIRAFPLEINL